MNALPRNTEAHSDCTIRVAKKAELDDLAISFFLLLAGEAGVSHEQNNT